MKLLAIAWLIFRLLTLPAELACNLVAGELASECQDVCTREAPWCQDRGVHPADSWAASRMYHRALRRGLVAEWCPWDDPQEWGVRSPWGLSVAYTASRGLGLRCLPPSLYDTNIVSALAWTGWAEWLCEERGACSALDRRRHASGAAKWDRRWGRFAGVCAWYGGALGYEGNRVFCEEAIRMAEQVPRGQLGRKWGVGP